MLVCHNRHSHAEIVFQRTLTRTRSPHLASCKLMSMKRLESLMVFGSMVHYLFQMDIRYFLDGNCASIRNLSHLANLSGWCT